MNYMFNDSTVVGEALFKGYPTSNFSWPMLFGRPQDVSHEEISRFATAETIPEFYLERNLVELSSTILQFAEKMHRHTWFDLVFPTEYSNSSSVAMKTFSFDGTP